MICAHTVLLCAGCDCPLYGEDAIWLTAGGHWLAWEMREHGFPFCDDCANERQED